MANEDNPEIELTNERKSAPSGAPVFPLERLRSDCTKLFGVSTSTFDGATLGLNGEFSVEELSKKIKNWQNRRVFPAHQKEVK